MAQKKPTPHKIDARHWLLDMTDENERTADGKPISRAIVVKGSKRSKGLTQIAAKSLSSQVKVRPDEARDLYKTDQVVEPFVPINVLNSFAQTCSIHSIALQRKARVIAGLGIKPVAKENERELRQLVRKSKRREKDPALESWDVDENKIKDAETKLAQLDRDKKTLSDWIESVGDDVPLREILERCWYDYEALGWFAMEVVPDKTGRPAQLVHLPAHLVRRAKDRERFAYLKTPTKKVWFKKFGSKMHLNATTGEISTEALSDNLEANEIIFWYQYSALDPFYGVPGWYAAMPEILGSNEARDFMLFYFTRRATPTYALTLEGGTWGPNQLSAIRNFFRRDLTGDYHATLLLETPKEGKIVFQRLTDEPRWVVLVIQYLNGLRDAIVSAHGLSPALLGIIETAHLGGGSGSEQMQVFKTVEARPKQETLEGLLNLQLVRKGLKIETQRLKLDELDIFDEQVEVSSVSTLYGAPTRPTITLNEARKRLRYEPVDEEWADEILVQGPNGLTPLSQLELPPPAQPQQQGGGMTGSFGGMEDYGAGGSGDLSGVFGDYGGGGNGNSNANSGGQQFGGGNGFGG